MKQQPFDFESFDAGVTENRAVLLAAILRCKADLHLKVFCEEVFRFSEARRPQPYVASLHKIASDVLLCSVSKAQATVARALGARLVRNEHAEKRLRVTGRYWIDWKGVSLILSGGTGVPRMAAGPVEDFAADGDDLSGDDLAPRGEREVAAAATRPSVFPATGERAECGSSDVAWQQTLSSTTTTSFATKHQRLQETQGAPARFVLNTNTPDPDSGSGFRTPEFITSATSGALARYFGESPVLREAATRPIAPKASPRLMHGVFAPLEAAHFTEREVGTFVAWFRGQLAAPLPVLASTEAHLLLAIGTAIYVTRVPDHEVRKNRVALFTHCVVRKHCLDGVKFVPDARRRLDAWIAWCEANGHGDDVAALYETPAPSPQPVS